MSSFRLRMLPPSAGRQSNTLRRQFLALALAALLVLPNLIFNTPLIIQTAHADTATPVSITAFGTAVTQNFDTLVSSGTSSTTPTGWGFSESLANANTTYTAGTGSSTTGDTYSFGSANAPADRALGQLRSGTLASIIGASFTNNTGGTINSLAISYAGEQWRLGATGRTVAERMDFQYSTNANSLTTGTYTDVNALDFNPPVTSGTVGLLDGNANRITISSTITGLNIPAGATFWIRWTDVDATGADDGLAIDDFSLTANGTIAQPALSINDVSQAEGNSGTSLFTFTVSLSAAPTAPVTFDIATADGNINPANAGSDYVARNLTGQTIPAGPGTTYTFNVTVNGDTNVEPNETFLVNVTNVTGATISDGTGQGTIVNDDAAPTPPSGAGAASPSSVTPAGTTLLTVAVTPGTNPTSVTHTVSADLSSIGGSATQQFFDDGSNGDMSAGDNTFSFSATVAANTAVGAKSLPVNITETSPLSRTGTASIVLTVEGAPVAAGSVVISQVYGGGGNSGATLKNDFIELFNRSTSAVSLQGWSVQYSSANGSTWQVTNLTNVTLQPGQYYLVQEAAGTGGTTNLPTPDATGTIGMAAGSGKVALVRNGVALSGTCPTGNSNVMDFVGYGTVNCSEGDDTTPGDSAAPTLSSTAAALRDGDGCTDTGSNAADFAAGSPNPRNTSAPTHSCDVIPPPPNNVDSTVVISQVYAGGGNSGAIYLNDYVELYNRGTSTVNLAGWSLQYASATGSGWDSNKQPLGGTIAPGEYYLISLASGGATGQSLPPANVAGEINMSATAGKIALVKNFDGLEDICPLSDPDLADFVGYGSTASCGEGNKKAPSPGTANAIFRLNGGGTDTDNNQADFLSAAPNPRRTAPIVEIGPAVLGTDPRTNATTAPRDASITVNFTEAVNVAPDWFNISCTTTGLHNDAMVTGGPKAYLITPNASFINGEQCTITVYKNSVHDQDTDDVGPNDDTLSADYTWTFATSTGTAPPYPSDVHLTMGNPNGATADTGRPNNYLMQKPEFALSYNRERGTPNWVSWHLSDEWIGSLTRVDSFRPDPAVPSDWYRVLATDYAGSGFDRGHMTPNADRDKETSIPINQATFLMSNMVPQAPDNNQGPWAAFEGFLRTLLPANEIYIVSGPAGVGGVGSAGPNVVTTIAGGHVTVPASTWKVALVIPKGDDDVSRVNAATRTIAVVMPNVQGIRNNDWHVYLTTVDQVEALTGYDFFTNVPDAVENSIEAGVDGTNPPGTAGQSVTTAEDTPTNITLTVASPNINTLTYTISQPAHGTLTGTGTDRVYTPAAEYKGPDSFTFSVSDGSRNSNVSTVTLNVTEVNDAPIAAADNKSTNEDTPLAFPAGELTANDNTGATDEGEQILSVTNVASTPDTHGTVALNNGQVLYSPAADYNGPASFNYEVCDNGTTNGALDSKCATASVSITVASVNDNPSAAADTAETDEDTPVTFDVLANDTDVDGDTPTLVSAGNAMGGSVAIVSGAAVFTPAADYNGTGSFSYSISDGHGGTATGTVSVNIHPVNDAPVLMNVPTASTIDELSAYTFTAAASDVDVPGQALTFSLMGAPAGASINATTGQFTWTPTEAQGGTGTPYHFNVRVSDGVVNTDAEINIAVNEVNQAPTLAHIGNQAVALGGTLTFTAVGADGDLPAQTLTYSLTGAVPAGATINSASGAFSWTPSVAQVGAIYTFGVRVTDSGSGNLYADESISVGVGYTYTGVLQPINANGSSIFKLGRTVPVKFALTGASAGINNAAARLFIAKLSDGIAGTELAADSTAAATEGNLFRHDPAGGQYIFNLSTSGLTTGTYQLRIDMGDGVLRVVNISLKN